MADCEVFWNKLCWIIFLICCVSSSTFYAQTIAPVLCSDLLCDDDTARMDVLPANCSTIVNECQCHYNPNITQYTSMPIMCPYFSSLPVNMFYDRFNQKLSLFPGKEKPDFQTFILHFKKFLSVVKYRDLKVGSFCGISIKIGWIPHASYTTTPEDKMIHLNVAHFPILMNLTELHLESNCFVKVTGIFSNVFPNLEKLNLNNNFLVDVSDNAFFELRHLQELTLFNNRLQEIRPKTLKSLTSLTTLELPNNNIENLDEEVFSSLVSLEKVNLNYNHIKILPPNLFRKNHQLQEISLTHNVIEEVPASLFFNLTRLTKLWLDDNQILRLSSSIFNDLRKLEIIHLQNNRLLYVFPNQFVKNYKLKSINLYNNALTELPELHLEGFMDGSVAEINLERNNISKIEIPLVERIKMASKLSLSHNCLMLINEIDIPDKKLFGASIQDLECRNCCLFDVNSKLLKGITHTADFNGNYMQKIDMRLFSDTAHLNSVDFSDNLISLIEVDWSYPLIQDKNKLDNANPHTVFNLHGNLLNCDCKLYPFVLFMNTSVEPPAEKNRSSISFDITDVFCIEPKPLYGIRLSELLTDSELQYKLICNISSEDCPTDCYCVYAPAQGVTIYYCCGKELKEFPQVTGNGSFILHLEDNLIRYLPHEKSLIWLKIEELYLKNNLIDSVENVTITTNIRVLDLRYNLLTDFKKTIHSVSKHRVRLLLSGNPWKCNCDLQQVRSLVFTQISVKDAKNLSCNLPATEFSVYLSEASDSQLCPELLNKNRALRIYLPIFASILTLVAICITLLYRFNAEVQHWLFTHGYCLSFITEDDVDCAKTYDAFVSYSNLDEDWVANYLVPGLETGSPSYLLCLHDRDWPVGEWIPDQIFKSVQESRRTIIVLTENFVASDWSRLEFKAAHQQAIADQVNRVLIVIPNKVPELKTIDEELRTYITLNTYIKGDDVHFWRKLRAAMPRNKALIEN